MADTIVEEWRDCPVYPENYEVSNTGKVRNRFTKKELVLMKDKKGYERVRLSLHDHKASAKVHRLVAIAFIENTFDKPQVNHKDGNKTNNVVTNLEWCTNGENQKHAYAFGLNHVTGRAGRKKIPIIGVSLNSGEKVRFPSIAEAARSTGTASANIGKAIRGERKKAGGFAWSIAPQGA